MNIESGTAHERLFLRVRGQTPILKFRNCAALEAEGEKTEVWEEETKLKKSGKGHKKKTDKAVNTYGD